MNWVSLGYYVHRVDILKDYCVSRECFTYFLFFKNDGLFVLHNRTYMNHLLMVLINSDKMTICLSTDRFLRGI